MFYMRGKNTAYGFIEEKNPNHAIRYYFFNQRPFKGRILCCNIMLHKTLYNVYLYTFIGNGERDQSAYIFV